MYRDELSTSAIEWYFDPKVNDVSLQVRSLPVIGGVTIGYLSGDGDLTHCRAYKGMVIPRDYSANADVQWEIKHRSRSHVGQLI